MIRKIVLSIIFVCLGYSSAIAGWPQVWKVFWVTTRKPGSLDETLVKVATTRNPLGFTFSIRNINTGTAHLDIPLLYSTNFSTEKSYIKIRVDNYPVKMPECKYGMAQSKENLLFQAYTIQFHPDIELIKQLKEGNILKISYYVKEGWSDWLDFTLKGSRKAIDMVITD